jgi:hypothetical protein
MRAETRVNEGIRHYPTRGNNAAKDRYPDVSGVTGHPCRDTESQAVTVCKMTVDYRSHTVEAYIYLLEKPRPECTTGGADHHEF